MTLTIPHIRVSFNRWWIGWTLARYDRKAEKFTVTGGWWPKVIR